MTAKKEGAFRRLNAPYNTVYKPIYFLRKGLNYGSASNL